MFFRSRKRPVNDKKHRSLRRPLFLEQLETRELLSSSPLNVQLISADDVKLAIVGGQVQLADSSQVVIATQSLADTSAVNVTAATGVTDTLRVDYSGGLFGIPITFNGASDGTDGLVIQAGQFTSTTYTATGAGTGSVSADGESISYTGLTSLQDTTAAVNRTFDLTQLPLVSQQVRLSNAGDAAGQFTLDSNGTGTFVSQTVANPTGALKVLGSAIGTTFYLDSLDAGLTAPLSITGGAGNDSLVLHDGLPATATVNFDGAGGTNTVVNPAALGFNLRTTNVQNTVNPVAYVNDALNDVQSFIQGVQGVVQPVLRTKLPLLGTTTIDDLLNDAQNGIGYNFFSALQNSVSPILSNVTLSSAADTIATALGLTSSQFNITIEDTAAGPVMSLNFDIELSKTLLAFYTLDLGSAGLPLQGTIPLDLGLTLNTQFSLQVNFSNDIANPAGGVSTDDMSVAVNQFEMGATLSSSAINTAVTVPGLGSLTIQNGTASIGGVLSVALSNPNSPLTVTDLQAASSFASLLAFTPQVPLSFNLPVTAAAGTSTFGLSGTADLTFDSTNLLSGAVPSITLAVTGGQLSVANFGYISGDFAFQVGQTATVQLDGGNPAVTKQVSIIEVGGSGVNVFAGTGTPVFDAGTTPSAGTHGFLIGNTSFALALLTPTDPTDTSLYYDLSVSGNAQTVGLPAGVAVDASNLSVQINGSTDMSHVVDFTASFPAGTTAPAGLEVLTGGTPIYLDDSDRKLQVDTDATLTALGQSVSGHFDFTDDNGNFSASASNLSAALQAGDPVNILSLASGTGSFTMTDDGVYGLATLTLDQGPSLPDVSLESGTFTLQLNSTGSNYTVDGTQLDAGQVLVEMDGLNGGTTGITILGNTLTAQQFFFEEDGNGNVDVSATDASIDLSAGSLDVLQLSGGTLALQLGPDGVAGTVSMTSLTSNAIPDLTLTATGLEVDVNTTPTALDTTIGDVAVNVPAGALDNNGNVIPYVHVALSSAELKLANVFDLTSQSFTLTAGTDGNGNTEVAVDAEGVTFAAGPSGTPALSLTGSADFVFDNGDFTLTSASLSTSSLSIPSVLSVDNPTVSLSNLTVPASGPITGTISISADAATLFPGAVFTASASSTTTNGTTTPGLSGTFTLGTNGAFSLDLNDFDLKVANAVEATASSVLISYDPSDTDPHQQLVEIDQGTVNFPMLNNLSGTFDKLDIYADGFAFDTFTVTTSSVTVSSLFTANTVTVTVSGFGVTYGQALTYSGSIGVMANTASFGVGQLSAKGQHLSGTVTFADNNVSDLVLSGSATLQLGSDLSITATDFTLDTGATDSTTPYATFGSATATIGPISASVSGLSFYYDGDIVTGSNGFSIDLSSSASASSALAFPSWLPISISQFAISWANSDLTTDPANFTIALSASVNTSTLFGLPLSVQGSFTNLQLDPDKLASGEFPIIGFSAASLSISGSLFGGTVSGSLTFGVDDIRPDPTDPTQDQLVTDGSHQPGDISIMYGLLQGGFTLGNTGGFTITLGLSQLGPLDVGVALQTETGLLLDPDTGLAIKGFTGAVEFDTSLPSITDPTQLRGLAEQITAPSGSLAQQVLTQYESQQDFSSELSEPMIIEGSATLFSEYLSTNVFSGTVSFAVSTPGPTDSGPKILVNGTLDFFNGTLSMSADLYADFSQAAAGSVAIYFLSDIPNNPQLLTLEGALTLNFIDAAGNKVVPTPGDPTAGGDPAVGFQIQLGSASPGSPVVELVAPDHLLNSDLLDFSGTATLTFDTINDVFTLNVNGQLSLYYFGTVGAAVGQFVLDLNDNNTAQTSTGGLFSTLTPELWGVLDVTGNLNQLQPYGVTVTGSELLEINTTGATQTEMLKLPGSTDQQTFTLDPTTFELDVAGDLAVTLPGTTTPALDLTGTFDLVIAANEVAVDASFAYDLPVLGTFQGDADFTLNASGFFGDALLSRAIGGDIGGTGFSLSGQFLLDINTTGNPQTVPKLDELDTDANGDVSVNTVANGTVAAGVQVAFGGKLELDGPSTNFGNFDFFIGGTASLAVNTQTDTLTAQIDGSVNIPGLPAADLTIDKSVTLQASGIVLDDNLDLPGAFNLGGAGSVLTLDGALELRVNTTNATQQGIPAATAEIDVTNLDLAMFGGAFSASGSLTIGIVDGGFTVNIPAANPLTFSFFGFGDSYSSNGNTLNFTVNGFINPGSFQLTAGMQLTLGNPATAGATADLTATIGDLDGSAEFAGSFSATGTLFDVTFANLAGSLDVSNGVVTLTITVPVINKTETWVLGSISTPPPPPALATLIDGSTLRLNMGSDAQYRGTGYTTDDADSYVVTHVSGNAASAGGETVLVTALGYSETYSGVTTILANQTGSGDAIQIAKGVTANASLTAGSGNDLLDYEGSGSATLNGGSGNDLLEGGSGTNSLVAGSGNDTLTGGSGTNSITAGAGNDTISAGSAAASISWSAGDGPATITGVAGGSAAVTINDTNANEDLVVAGANGALPLAVGSTTLSLTNIATLGLSLGGAGGDTLNVGDLTGTGLAALNLNLGSHTNADSLSLTGADGGDDLTLASASQSTLSVSGQGMVTTTISGAATGDQLAIYGGAGNDTMSASGVATALQLSLYGGAGNNALTGSTGADFLHGGTGNDTINGGGGNDTIYGGTGNDSITAGGGDVTIFGGAGDDTIQSGTGPSAIYGGTGNNTIYAKDTDTWVDGGSGGANTLILSTTVADTLAGSTIYPTAASPASGLDLLDFSSATVNAGAALTLNNPARPSLTVNAGSNTVTVQHLAQSATINSTGAVTVDDIQAPLTVSGGSLTVDRTANVIGDALTLSATSLSGIGNNSISVSDLTALTLKLSNGDNTLSVTGTPAPTTVNGGNANDAFTISGASDVVTFNGGGGTLNTLTIVLPKSGGLTVPDIGTGIQQLTVDGTAFPSALAWTDSRGVLSVAEGPTTELNALDTTPAGQTFIKSPHPSTDTLTVEDSVSQPQTVTLQSNTVLVQEGLAVVGAGGGAVTNPAVAPAVTADSSGSGQVYAADPTAQTVDVYARTASTGTLSTSPTQQIQDWLNTQAIAGTTSAGTFGYSVATYGDYAVVGAPAAFSTASPVGAAYVYQNNGGQWQLVATLAAPAVPTGDLYANAGFGTAVAITQDYIAVGAPLAASGTDEHGNILNEGAVYVFTTQNGTWSLSTTLTSTDQPDLVYKGLGSSLAMIENTDKSATIIAGAPTDYTPGTSDANTLQATGSAYLFSVTPVTSGSTDLTWSQVAKLTPPTDGLTADYLFGKSVALAGGYAVVGAPSSDSAGDLAGHVYVYADSDSGWSTSPYATFSAGTDQNGFGSAVSVQLVGAVPEVFAGMPNSEEPSGTDTVAVTGATAANGPVVAGSNGAVLAFQAANGGIWNFTPIAPNSGADVFDEFGSSLSLDNGELLVGASDMAHAAPGNALNSGVLYLFDNLDTTPREIAQFQPSDNTSYTSAGYAVALDGSSIFMTAPFNQTDTGSIFVFGSSLAGASATALVGNDLYVTSATDNSISVFQRDPTTGALTFVQDIQEQEKQYVTVNGKSTSVNVTAMDGADSIAASPDGTTVFVGSTLGIAVFSRNATGELTFTQSNEQIDLVSSLAIDATGTTLYATAHGQLVVYEKDGNGVWNKVQLFNVAGSTSLQGAASVVVSADGDNVYVAASGASAIATFSRNATTGLLTYQSIVVNGLDGVDGIGGVAHLAFTADGAFLIADGPSENALAVFQLATAADPSTHVQVGDLEFVQRLVQGVGGISGINPSNSVAVSPDGAQLYVGSAGQLSWFPLATTQPALTSFNVTYSGIHQLTVDTGGGDDTVKLGTISEANSTTQPSIVNLNTYGGNDTVVAQDTQPNVTNTINLGSGDNTFLLEATGEKSSWKVSASSGTNTFVLDGANATSNVSLTGGSGDDTFTVDGAAIPDHFAINGGGSPDKGDTLNFDIPTTSTAAYTYPYIAANPYLPEEGNGDLRIGILVPNSNPVQTQPAAGDNQVGYSGINTIWVETAPVANAGGPYTINEGAALSLTGSGSSVTQTPGTYGWDLTGAGTFTDALGVTPTLSWAELTSLGITVPGTYPINLRVTDAAGNVDQAATTLTVADVAPTLTSLSGGGAVQAGTPVTFNAAATSPGGAYEPLTYAFNFGDGSAVVTSSTGVTSHAFATAGTYTVSVTASDGYNGVSTALTTTVTVAAAAAAPTASISGPATGTAGQLYTLTLGPATDPATGWTINWGDGTSLTVTGNPSSATHTYATSGTDAINATETSAAGSLPTNPVSVQVANVTPTVSISGPTSVPEGLYTLSLAAAGLDNDPLTGWTINWGDGSATQNVFGSPNTVTHVFAALNPALNPHATYTITASATNAAGTYSAASLTIAVTPVAPTITAAGVAAPGAVEGSPATLFADATIPGNEALTYTFLVNGASIGTSTTGQLAYSFPSAGAYPASVVVSATNGSSSNTLFTANVFDAIPTLTLISTPANATIPEGTALQLNLAFSDPGTETVTGYRIDWGDGTDVGYTVNGTSGLNPTHVYTDGGTTNTAVVYDVTTTDNVYGQLGSIPVTVEAVAPTIVLSGALQVVQGQPYTLTLGAVTDPGNEIATSYTINWGDGTSDMFNGAPIAGTAVTHTYANSGGQTIEVTLVDRNGTYNDAGQQAVVVLSDTGPTADAGGPYTVALGNSITLDATGSVDPLQSSASLSYAWDFQGNGLFADATGATPTFTAGPQYGPGPWTVSVQVTDAEGLSSVASAVVNIQDVAPTADFTNGGPVNVGSPMTVAFSNPVSLSNVETAAGFAYSIATDPVDLATSYAAASANPAQAITFDDIGSQIVYGRIFDQAGSSSDYTTAVTVNEVPPTAVLSNNGPISEGSSAMMSFSAASDPSSAATAAGFHYSFALDPSDLATTYAAAGTSATQSFPFTTVGTATVYGRIFDKNDGTTDYTTTVVVNDVPPSNLTLTQSATDIQADGSLTLGGTFAGPGALNTYVVSINWGDGSTPTTVNVAAGVLSFSGVTHQYLDNPPGQPNGSFPITVTVTDNDGGQTSASTSVEVDNVPPTAVLSNSGPINAASSATVSFTGAFDPSPVDRAAGFTYSFALTSAGLATSYSTAGTSSSQPFAFDDAGTYTVYGRIFDADNVYTDDTTTVVVNDVAPTATLGNNGPINAGSSATVSFSNPFDPSNAVTTAGFHYSFATDPSQLVGTYATAGTSASQTIPFDDAGTYTVYGRIFDKNDGYTDYTTTVVVNDVPPTATLSNNGPINAGTSATISFSNESDPSETVTNAGFHFSYATNPSALVGSYAAAGTNGSQSIAFANPGTYTVYGRIFDVNNGSTDYTTTVTVNDVPPTATLSNNGPIGDGFSATVSFSNASDVSPAVTTAGFHYSFALTSSGLASSYSSAGTASAQSFYFDDVGTYTVYGRIFDVNNSSTGYTTTVTVNDTPPTATFGNNGPINEGSSATVSFSKASDPSQAATVAGFHYSFALSSSALATSYSAAGTGTAQTFPFAQYGSYTVYGRIFDKNNGYTNYTTTVVVNNVPPTVTPGANVTVQPGIPTSITLGSFTDPGIDDEPWTVDVNWGDGSADTIFTRTTQGTLPAQTHTYALSGNDTITVNVTDNDGGKGSATLQVSVLPSLFLLDPTAGGALSLSGNANANVPGGVVVDSSSSQAISASGYAKLTTPTITVHGGIQTSGNATVSGKVTTGVNLANPLASLTYAPTIPAAPPAVSVAGSSSQTIQPGTYASISVSGNGSLTLSPGIYVIAGGGLAVTGNATLSGQGVAIYNTRNTHGTYGSINLAGNGKISLTPPASGQPLAGILIFQDPANTKGLSISGNGALGLNGTVYAPTAQVTVSGNTLSQVNIVADELTLSGDTTFNDLNAPAGAVAYSPAQLRDAYSVNSLAYDGTGQTIAIVDAYDDPNINQALDQFDSQFGTTATGATLYGAYGPASAFLTVLNQNGQSTALPGTDPSGPGVANWESEEALDVEWTHAMAPGARIILVEADSQALGDLMASVATAAQQPGVSVVSMSWGFTEGQAVVAADEATYDSYLTTPAGHTPVTFVASTGDFGSADPEYPAFSPNVVAVGGTSLTLNADGSYNSETGWGYYSDTVGTFIASGGGVSQFEPQPGYQSGVQSTGYRTTPDVAFVADPATGAWIADPYNLPGDNPWQVVGGTSLSAPAWAGLIALVNQGRADAGAPTLSSDGGTTIQAALYNAPAAGFNAITSGTNGGYTAAAGYNLVTGLGTPVANQLVPSLIAYTGTAPANATADPGQGGNGSGNNGGANLAVFNVFNALPVGMPMTSFSQPSTGTLSSTGIVPQPVPPTTPRGSNTVALPLANTTPQRQLEAVPLAAPTAPADPSAVALTLANTTPQGQPAAVPLAAPTAPAYPADAFLDDADRATADGDIHAAFHAAFADWALTNDCGIDPDELARLVWEK